MMDSCDDTNGSVSRLVTALPSPNTTDTAETEARCESRCGDDSGSPALCRYFCANSEVQVKLIVQPHLQNLHFTINIANMEFYLRTL